MIIPGADINLLILFFFLPTDDISMPLVFVRDLRFEELFEYYYSRNTRTCTHTHADGSRGQSMSGTR